MVQSLAATVSAQADDVSRSAEATTPKAVWTEYELMAAEAARSGGKRVYHVTAQIDPLCAMPIAARQLVANGLGSVAQILGSRPEPGAAAEAKVLDLLVATTQTTDEVIGKCPIPTVLFRTGCFPTNS